MPLLNKTLSSKPIAVRFLTPPIAVPIDGYGMVCSIEQAEGKAFVAPVIYKANIYRFEFGTEIYAGLRGYYSRHGDLSDRDIIFYKDSEIKMTIGLKGKNVTDLREQVEQEAHEIEKEYKGKIGYQMNDIK